LIADIIASLGTFALDECPEHTISASHHTMPYISRKAAVTSSGVSRIVPFPKNRSTGVPSGFVILVKGVVIVRIALAQDLADETPELLR
jgi:hypothetical protein